MVACNYIIKPQDFHCYIWQCPFLFICQLHLGEKCWPTLGVEPLWAIPQPWVVFLQQASLPTPAVAIHVPCHSSELASAERLL